MECLIAYTSALEYWRSTDLEFPCTRFEYREATDHAQRILQHNQRPTALTQEALILGLSQPLHVLVGTPQAQTRTNEIQSHYWKAPLLELSTTQIAQRAFVSTPEFCFLQMASNLSLIQLILLGFELCGTYRLPDNSSALQRKIPLTSTAKLQYFVNKAGGRRGRKQALRALQYIADNSASPMETALTLLLCLPYSQGGYGMPYPILNHQIDPTTRSKMFADRSYFKGDLRWPSAKLCLEYDSKSYHLSPHQQQSDASRRNSLAALGFTVMTVSSKQLFDTYEFARLARQVSKITEKRIRCSNPDFTLKQRELREHIFAQ